MSQNNINQKTSLGLCYEETKFDDKNLIIRNIASISINIELAQTQLVLRGNFQIINSSFMKNLREEMKRNPINCQSQLTSKKNKAYACITHLKSTNTLKQEIDVDSKKIEQKLSELQSLPLLKKIKSMKGKALVQIIQERMQDKTIISSKKLKLNFDTKLRTFQMEITTNSVLTTLYLHSAEIVINEQSVFKAGSNFGFGKFLTIFRLKRIKFGREIATNYWKVQMQQRSEPDSCAIGLSIVPDAIPSVLQFSIGLREPYSDIIMATPYKDKVDMWYLQWMH